MKASCTKFFSILFLITISLITKGQISTTYTAQTFLHVPAGVSSITIEVYGGAGGYGGMDGAGNTNASAGNPGYLKATYSVVAGDLINIYPGGNGGNGANSATSSGGGAGGSDTYPSANYNGGNGGNAGPTGSSGGGGGGAATVVTKNGSIIIVAGGAAGGGGMANLANSGKAGNNTMSANGTNTFGGNGVAPGAGVDGGGSGAGGGGSYGSIAGTIYKTSGPEYAGNGGFRGDNLVTGQSVLTTNGFAASVSGQVIITSNIVLPVTLINFTSQVNAGNVLLQWSTATEQNSLNFAVQRSNNGTAWEQIGIVDAAGNSNSLKSYSFTDKKPLNSKNYYRLVQKDYDGHFTYSKTVTAELKVSAGIISVYPNPVENGMLNIDAKENTIMYLYSNEGRKLMERKLTAGKQIINVSGLAKGSYFIKTDKQTLPFIIN
ncbi:MAG: T9SS type A sorting domain-containing protein [Ferruginibacter sp.]